VCIARAILIKQRGRLDESITLAEKAIEWWEKSEDNKNKNKKNVTSLSSSERNTSASLGPTPSPSLNTSSSASTLVVNHHDQDRRSDLELYNRAKFQSSQINGNGDGNNYDRAACELLISEWKKEKSNRNNHDKQSTNHLRSFKVDSSSSPQQLGPTEVMLDGNDASTTNTTSTLRRRKAGNDAAAAAAATTTTAAAADDDDETNEGDSAGKSAMKSSEQQNKKQLLIRQRRGRQSLSGTTTTGTMTPPPPRRPSFMSYVARLFNALLHGDNGMIWTMALALFVALLVVVVIKTVLSLIA
jgi:hypothetical protein